MKRHRYSRILHNSRQHSTANGNEQKSKHERQDHRNAMMKGTGLDAYEEWCDRYARRLRLEVKEVEAPAALKVHGIMKLKAYPEALLEIRCTEVP